MTAAPAFAGIPVVQSQVLRDGAVYLLDPSMRGGQRIIVGTRPLTLAEDINRACRLAVRRGLADVLAWLGEEVENEPTSTQILAELRAEALRWSASEVNPGDVAELRAHAGMAVVHHTFGNTAGVDDELCTISERWGLEGVYLAVQVWCGAIRTKNNFPIFPEGLGWYGFEATCTEDSCGPDHSGHVLGHRLLIAYLNRDRATFDAVFAAAPDGPTTVAAARHLIGLAAGTTTLPVQVRDINADP